MGSRHHYTPLKSARGFRLLKITGIVKGESPRACKLTGSLDTFTLNEDHPPYVALSYTWDSPFTNVEQSRCVEDNELTISVSHDGRSPCEQRIRRNLFDALLYLYDKYPQMYIWADAMCINQEQTDERTSQVQLMGDIYSNPTLLVAWLGPAPNDIKDILWWYGPFVEYLDHYCETHTADSETGTIMPQTLFRHDAGLDQNVLVLNGSDIIVTEDRLRAIGDWFENTRYFTRIWVFQELALPQEVKYVVGSHELCTTEPGHPLDIHTVLWMWLAHNALNIRQLFSLGSLPRTGMRPEIVARAPVTFPVWLSRRERESKGRSVLEAYGASSGDSEAWAYLEQTFARSSHLVATNPVDKIYGMLGVLSRSISEPREIIQVRYDIPTVDLLKMISMKMIQSLPYLTCFALKPPSYYSVIKGLPSWAIDLTATVRGLQPGGLSSLRQRPYAAFPSRTEDNIKVHFQGDTLCLSGHLCGKITTIVQGFGVDGTKPGFSADQVEETLRAGEYMSQCLELACDMGPAYCRLNDQPILNALIQASTLSIPDADTGLVPKVTTRAFWSLVKTSWQSLADLTECNNESSAETARKYIDRCKLAVAKLGTLGVKVPAVLLQISTGLSRLDTMVYINAESMKQDLHLVAPLATNTPMVNRRLFRSEHDFIGLCADSAKPGDEIWVLCRARVPQILHPLPDGSFALLGEAYVHGGVDGELFEQGIAGPRREIRIV